MPKGRQVVSNTSPLLNLALIDRLDLLQSQFSGLEVPEQVWEEIQAGELGTGAVESLRNEDFLNIVSVPEDELFRELQTNVFTRTRYVAGLPIPKPYTNEWLC